MLDTNQPIVVPIIAKVTPQRLSEEIPHLTLSRVKEQRNRSPVLGPIGEGLASLGPTSNGGKPIALRSLYALHGIPCTPRMPPLGLRRRPRVPATPRASWDVTKAREWRRLRRQGIGGYFADLPARFTEIELGNFGCGRRVAYCACGQIEAGSIIFPRTPRHSSSSGF